MSYVALYRKFRPKTFEEVKGQDAIVTTLKNQITAGRIQHAYLFCGTRGTGKTSVAKIFAKAVNCEHPVDGSPCNECAECTSISRGTSMNVIEIDAASNNGVDNIREIIDEVQYRPAKGKYKVYIIDEVHMLSSGAFNALLKTLEEPPEYVIFILATTEAAKIPLTILSRCQRYDFHRIGIDILTDRMNELLIHEHVEAEDKALRYIARAADGSMRDALSLLDMCMAFYIGEKLTYDKVLNVLGAVDIDVFGKLIRKILHKDAAGSIEIYEDMVASGREVGQFVTDFTWYLRNLLLVRSAQDEAPEIIDVSSDHIAELRNIASETDNDTLMRYIRILAELTNQIRYASNQRVLVEIALIRLCRPQMQVTDDAVLDRIRQLESKVEELEKNPPGNKGTPGSGNYGGRGVTAAGDGTAPDHSYHSDTDGYSYDGRSTPAVKAAPEDLQKIKADWKLLVQEMREKIEQVMVAHAVTKYNPDADDGKLYIEFSDPMAERLVHDEAIRTELMQIIERHYGKHVEIEMRLSTDRGGRLAEINVEEILKKNINMQVEETGED